MAFELACDLDKIDWETFRDEVEANPIHTTVSHSQECAPPSAVDTAPALVEPAADTSAHGSNTGMPLNSVQPAPGMSVLPYYVNHAPYPAQNVHIPHAAHRPGHSAIPAVGPPAQQLIFAQPNNQMMYMPVPPYYHQPPCSQPAPLRQMYAPVQNAYYPQVVLLPQDGKVAQVMPAVSQPFSDYRTPQSAQVRPAMSAPQQQTHHQPRTSNTETASSFAAQQGNFVYLIPGTQLPQSVPFFPQGVRVTNHYTNSWTQAPTGKPPDYSSPPQEAPALDSGKTSPKVVDTSEMEGKETVNAPPFSVCEEGVFVSENVLRAQKSAAQGLTEASMVFPVLESSQKEVDSAACDGAD